MEEKAVEKTTIKITPTFEYIDLILALHVEFESKLRYMLLPLVVTSQGKESPGGMILATQSMDVLVIYLSKGYFSYLSFS